MVGDKFPRQRLTAKPPMHVSLGELEVKGGGILSLPTQDVGTEKMFFDFGRAEADGHLGPEPKIWGAEECHMALEMMASGLTLEGKAWGDLWHHPTMWITDGEERASHA